MDGRDFVSLNESVVLLHGDKLKWKYRAGLLCADPVVTYDSCWNFGTMMSSAPSSDSVTDDAFREIGEYHGKIIEREQLTAGQKWAGGEE